MPDYSIFWGDLHNHNAVGYAKGTLERTYEIAREHLDFLAFTPHSQWHDMPEMPNDAHMKWVNGFRVLRENWPKVQRMAKESNRAGKFVSILAYEWHSSYFGDYCVYFPDDDREMAYHNHVQELQEAVRGVDGAIMAPHHLGYKQGWRGANWEHVDTTVSPIIEIFSEHGLSESDRGRGRYIRHSMGGRWTRNTVQRALESGVRAGFIASSDDHLGYPGAWGEGLAGIWAEDLSRASILDALWKRRTTAVTGDRIRLAVRLNDHWMGSALPFVDEREIAVEALGMDEIDRVDLLRNNRVIGRYFPEDHLQPEKQWPGEHLCRLEFGWGPWGDLNMARIADWKVRAKLDGGKILAVVPCFQSGPYDETRRDRITDRKQSEVAFELHTSRKEAFEELPTKSVVLRLTGPPSAKLSLELESPAPVGFQRSLGALAENNEVEITGRFTAESFLVHRLVPPTLSRVRTTFRDRGRQGRTDYYYVRVTQTNGQQAWASPIWVEG
ncbi:MAG: DUF3604 domain-containing protein [Acidobacteria bacterium]|nr:DUF3604 domain-containing protein [Acidobacteriota bacterium]